MRMEWLSVSRGPLTNAKRIAKIDTQWNNNCFFVRFYMNCIDDRK